MEIPSPSRLAIEDFKNWMVFLDEWPTQPSGFICDHRVPYSKVYRQWDTQGRLWVWVNRGMIEDLPRTRPEVAIGVVAYTGIPVFHIDPRIV